MINPRTLVPESVMPPYQFLLSNRIDPDDAEGWLRANRIVGVPYTDEMIEKAAGDLTTQLASDARRRLEKTDGVAIGRNQIRIHTELAADGWRELVIAALSAASVEAELVA